MSPPVTGVTYRRACVADATCSDNERKAALYDWVRNVYLADSRTSACADHTPRYDDHFLSDAERRCVEREVGVLTDVGPQTVSAFLDRAKVIYFNQVPGRQDNETLCKNPKMVQGRIVNGGDRLELDGFSEVIQLSALGHFATPNETNKGTFLGAYDGCPIESARLFTQSGAELAVAAHEISETATTWVFFIEGYDDRVNTRELTVLPVDLRNYFAHIATLLHIPVYDAVQRTEHHPDVVADAAQYSMDRPEQVWNVFSLATYMDRKRVGEDPAQIRTELTREVIAEGAEALVPSLLTEMDLVDRGILSYEVLSERIFHLHNSVGQLMPADLAGVLAHEHNRSGTLQALYVVEPGYMHAVQLVYDQLLRRD